MRNNNIVNGCSYCPISRRKFLAGCAACVGAAGLLAKPVSLIAANKNKMRIQVIYSLHAVKQPGPDWPNVGFDFGPVMKQIDADLAEKCPQFEFISSMANGPEEAKKILQDNEHAGVDGYIVYQLNCFMLIFNMAEAADFWYITLHSCGAGRPT
jgi:hypothetical protein